MTPRPLLLDLFCGAGGAAMGYSRAGFDVVGVDLSPQPRYPFRFIQGDALRALEHLRNRGVLEVRQADGTLVDVGPFVAIHASPPCQRWTLYQNAVKRGHLHPDYITPLRPRLTGMVYIIENVPGAPLINPVRVCMAKAHQHDGFELRRHRLFESNVPLIGTVCMCGSLPAAPVYGHGPGRWFYRKYGRGYSAVNRRRIMDVPWMHWPEESEAIPPAYTEFLGRQLLAYLAERAA